MSESVIAYMGCCVALCRTRQSADLLASARDKDFRQLVPCAAMRMVQDWRTNEIAGVAHVIHSAGRKMQSLDG